MDNNRVAAIAAYITWIGFLIAILIGERGNRFVAHHMNQALVLNIISVVGGAFAIIPVLGGLVASVVSFAVMALAILGIYRAYSGSVRPLPIVGDIHLIG